jgi:hypothetical protein
LGKTADLFTAFSTRSLLLRDRHGRDGRAGKKLGLAVILGAPTRLTITQQLRWLPLDNRRTLDWLGID